MKIKKLLLPLLMFFFFSCSNENISTSTGSSTASLSVTDETSRQEESISSYSSTSSFTSSTDIEVEEKNKWDRNIRKLFDEYIDGLYIPYIDLGNDINGEFSTSSTYGNLVLTGDREFNKDIFKEIDDYYQTFGYEVSYTSSILTASKDPLSIQVNENKSGEIDVSIFYQEPYDESRGLGHWDSEIKYSFDDYLYSYQLPYFYMGCRHPFVGNYISSGGYYLIHGGRYDTRVFNNAKVAFLNDEFSINESRDYNGLFYTFIKTFSNGDQIKVELINYSLSKPKNVMKVYFSEGFDKDSITDWTSDIKNDFNTYLDNHILPYFYMGSRNISSSFVTDKNSLYIYGGYYDERIFTYAITSFTSDSFTYTESRDNYGKKIVFNKTYSDDCYIEVTLATDSSDKVYLSTFYLPYMVINSNESEYGYEVTSLFSNYTSQMIPYVYLGRDDLDCYFENTKEEKNIKIIGDKYNPNMAFLAKTAYENDGYTVSLTRTIYGYDFLAMKTFDDDVKFIVTMKSKNYRDKGSESFVELNVNITDTNDYQKYNNDIKRYMNSLFSTSDLPYVFLGNSLPYIQVNTSTKTLKLTGSTFKGSMTTSLNESMDEDINTWEVKLETNSLTGLAHYSDHYIEMKLEKDSDGYALLTIQYLNEYDPKDDLEYSTALKNSFNKILDNYIPPYMYLNISQPTYYIGYQSVNALILKGGLYDERVFEYNKTILENNSFSVSIDNSSFGKRLIATKEDENNYYRIQIEKESSSSISRVQARIAVDKKVTLNNSTYSNDLITMLSEHDLSSLPYMDFGNYRYAKYNDGYLSITYDGCLKNDYIRKNKELLESYGFTTTYEEFNSEDVTYFFSTLKASYKDSVTGEKIYISFFPTYPLLSYSTYTINISHSDSYIDDNLDYSSNMKKDLNSFLQGYELPYIFMGNTTYSYDDETFTIIGDNYDRELFTNLENKLSTFSTFTYSKVKDNDDSYYYSLTNTNGDNILLHAYLSENKKTSIHRAILEISFTRGENRVSSYDSSQLELLKEVLNGNDIPYLDLGVDNDELIFMADYLKNQVTIKGGNYKEIYFSRIKDKLIENGYNVINSSTTIFASKVIDENTNISINVYVENGIMYLKANI